MSLCLKENHAAKAMSILDFFVSWLGGWQNLISTASLFILQEIHICINATVMFTSHPTPYFPHHIPSHFMSFFACFFLWNRVWLLHSPGYTVICYCRPIWPQTERSAFLCFLSYAIKGISHHTWPVCLLSNGMKFTLKIWVCGVSMAVGNQDVSVSEQVNHCSRIPKQ